MAGKPPSQDFTPCSSARLHVLDIRLINDAKLLRTVDLDTSIQHYVLLRDEWLQTNLCPGQIIRIVQMDSEGVLRPWLVKQTTSSTPITVSHQSNLLIVDPDTLVSGTSVADSFTCLRKSVISARVPSYAIGTAVVSEAALYGNMIHALFQTILLNQSVSRKDPNVGFDNNLGMEILEAVEDVIVQFCESLYAANITSVTARRTLHAVVPEMERWFVEMLSPHFGATTPASNMTSQVGSTPPRITGVADIEELIWSPTFGLKGKIDASVYYEESGMAHQIGPLELKTGKSSGIAGNSHSAQVMLYNVLMAERYRRPVRKGVLTYLRYRDKLGNAAGGSGGTSHRSSGRVDEAASSLDNRVVSFDRGSFTGLIMQRNKLADYLNVNASYRKLPELLTGGETLCARCFVNSSCLMQHKLLEDGTADTVRDGPGETLFNFATEKLDARHADYYKNWREIIHNEESFIFGSRSNIWNVSADRREAVGKCVANLKLSLDSGNGAEKSSSSGRMNVSFERDRRQSSSPLVQNSISGLGDYITISAEVRTTPNQSVDAMPTRKFTAISTGFLQSLSEGRIVVEVEKDLLEWANNHDVDLSDVVWRLDSNSIASSHNIAKHALEDLFCNEEMRNLRELIVEGRVPRFEKSFDIPSKSGPPFVGNIQLNTDQQKALRVAHEARDYFLLLGMPGTGKTTTLAAIIQSFVLKGKSVLLCSHTNAAVDNVLVALLQLGCQNFIRLGRNIQAADSRIHKYHERSIDNRDFLDGNKLEQNFQKPLVVASTCLGINHVLFSRRNSFHVVVIDEASQIVQPICIGPLRFSKGPFILVGDHYQLPPLTRKGSSKSDEVTKKSAAIADDSGSESLFRRLCQMHPSTVVSLRQQYRMTKEIMDLSNHMVYKGNLKTGSPATASQALNVRPPGSTVQSPWIEVLDPTRAVLFLDISKIARREGPIRGKKSEAECDTVIQAVKMLVAHGVKQEGITVLTPYRAQLSLISTRLRSENLTSSSYTIDQYQGKDNLCMIASLVNQDGGGLLEDWRRLNVLLTRAKQKLILVGNSEGFQDAGHVLTSLLQFLRQRNRVFVV